MKASRFLGLVALATLTLGSCSNDEVVNDYSQDNAIEFGTYMGRDAQSRASIYTTETMKETGFGVFANYNGVDTDVLPNFMNNQLVGWTAATGENETGEWTYSPIKYWPNTENHQVSFWAYAPYSASNTNPDVKTPTFAISEGTDFVAVATPVVSKKQAINEKVKFEFEHMMSRIGFKVEAIIDEIEHTDTDNGNKDEDEDYTNKNFTEGETVIVVTKVTMKGALKTNGIMTWTNNDWVLTTTEEIQDEPYVLEYNNFYAISYEACKENKATEEGGENTYETLSGQRATITKTQLNNEESYWMVIPQSVGMNIEVEYHVITRDENLADGYSNVKNTVKTSDFNFTFERGKAYDFVLHLGLTSVKFDAVVKEWDENSVNDIIVNVPINTKTTTASEGDTTENTTPDESNGGQNTGGETQN